MNNICLINGFGLTTLFQEIFRQGIYNVIREIEATFRTLKTDIDLRPYIIRLMKHQWHISVWDYWSIGLSIPFKRKKSVVPPAKTQKNKTQQNQTIQLE